MKTPNDQLPGYPLHFSRAEGIFKKLHTARFDYPSYPHYKNQKWLEKVIESIQVRHVTAVWFDCTSIWKIEERRVIDDTFHYIIKGRGKAIVNGRTHPLFPGLCFHFPKRALHSATTNPKHPIELISIHYTGTVFESLTVAEVLGFPDYFDFRGDTILDGMFRKACREYALLPPGHERGLEALVLRILLRLIQGYPSSFQMRISHANPSDLQRLFPALDLMRRELKNPKPISELARLVGYSAVQFRRIFSKTLGSSPIRFLRRLRIERAGWLLTNTAQTLESIAEEVGYHDPSFFAYTFKELTGVSPGKYRLNNICIK